MSGQNFTVSMNTSHTTLNAAFLVSICGEDLLTPLKTTLLHN